MAQGHQESADRQEAAGRQEAADRQEAAGRQEAESFPRQEARTRRFSLGVPRAFTVSPDGARVIFLRTRGGTDPVTCLWVLDVATGAERVVADPRGLGIADEENLPPQEKARRERVREKASGITAYATDAGITVAAFALSGEVYSVSLNSPDARPALVTTHTPALDPRPDPAGRALAYVCDGALRVTGLSGLGWDRVLADPERADGVTFGLPEFIAAEEMNRQRGYWWAPDGTALLVARVSDKPVMRWHIADPAHPAAAPAQVAYPAAGTPNAEVSLLIARIGGRQVPVQIDHEAFPYVVTARWARGRDPLVVVQSRDQRTMRLLAVDARTGLVRVLREDTDPHWLEIVPGVPAWTRDGRIVWAADSEDTRRLVVSAPDEITGASPVTPAGLQVRGVLGVDGDVVLIEASGAEPSETDLYTFGPAGLAKVTGEPGVHGGTRGGGVTVVTSRTLKTDDTVVQVLHSEAERAIMIENLAEKPAALPDPAPVLFAAGERGIRTAVLFPSWHKPGAGRLPVLLDPYGGPHAQRVLAARDAYRVSQWFAEQGFAVVIADGRGTPGRGCAWERAVAGDLATPVLEDQVAALAAAAGKYPDLDTGRVAIRGWSFGGYLSALAVLARPDVFHAAVAGAPVTDWRLYDTHYTERYLGNPEEADAPYRQSSLIELAERAVVSRARPLLLIHGLADDNVVVAHTLRLSAALLGAGYPHEVLPLTGITHMAASEVVAENLLLLQLAFLRRSLGMAG